MTYDELWPRNILKGSKFEKRIIKDSILHQDIGGKEFVIDEKITNQLTNDYVFNNAICGNWACWNFVHRRQDFNHDFPHKLYYGKVDGLGYIVAEDEFKD